MKVSKLTLTRKGSLRWYVVGPNHCGSVEHIRKIPTGHKYINMTYELSMVCQPQVDNRGFLVDQLDVDQFITYYGLVNRRVSCEKACINLAKALLKLLRAKAKHCKVLTLNLTLSPEPYLAAMTAEME